MSTGHDPEVMSKSIKRLRRSSNQVFKNKPHKCSYCAKRFTQKTSVQLHMRMHTGLNMEKCDYCGKKFASNQILKRHLITHTGISDHMCTLCRFPASCASVLQAHMRTHTEQQPFSCKLCKRRFKQKQQLRRHILLYKRKRSSCVLRNSGMARSSKKCKKSAQSPDQSRVVLPRNKELLFSCEKCSAHFPTQRTFRKHMNIQHQDPFRYTCGICHVQLLNHIQLGGHLKSHAFEGTVAFSGSTRMPLGPELAPQLEVYECHICSKEYKDSHALWRHVDGHGKSHASSIICPFCDLEFTSEQDFEEHVRLHTNEKPWECETLGT